MSYFKQFERKWDAIAEALISRAKTLRRGAWPHRTNTMVILVHATGRWHRCLCLETIKAF
jgi:hypothetical protein